MYLYRLFCLALALWGTLTLQAQFFLNGSAVMTNDSCYRLTNAVNQQVGSIWNGTKINLNESFEVALQVFLGCKDADGADGIVFGFQRQSTSVGVVGGGIGFAGVSPSLGIEIDTWQNFELNDPPYDHLAITSNGIINHNAPTNLAGPVQASASSANIEDCSDHDFRVVWDAVAKRLQVYFDCTLRLSYTGDIVNTIFGGDPEVFWGFTSATGGANNVHQVCFSYTTFLNQLEDVVLCPGGQARITAQGGISYAWTPVEGVSNPFIPNPVFSPTETTLYTVEIRDACNYAFFDDVLVSVAGNPVFFDLGPDTTLCQGEPLTVSAATPTATYQWADGRTAPTLSLTESGLYAVTVTRTDTFCIAADEIDVTFVSLPTAELPADTALCQGQSLVLRADFAPADYTWADGQKTDTLLVTESGTYSLSVRNSCGIAIDHISVLIDDCRQVYIPNAFSPNDDGRNDRFRPLHGGDVAQIHRFSIFDRWGGLVFHAEDVPPTQGRFGWDGERAGQPAAQGLYVWLLDLSFRDGHRTQLQGEVLLLR